MKFILTEGTVGIDEVGRGCLAGPVFAAAAFLPAGEYEIPGLKDSKQLSSQKRQLIYNSLELLPAIKYSIAWVNVGEIDRLNILQASLLAMEKAFRGLNLAVEVPILIDGNKVPQGLVKAIALPKGDQHIPIISLASVIAKVARDEFMKRLSTKYPSYEWEKNKGYGTKKHYEALKLHGISPEHRRSFNLAVLNIAHP